MAWTANEAGSQSGYYAALASAPDVLPEPNWSGSHLASIERVQNGTADWAAIDAVTWEIAQKCETTDGLVVWHRSEPTPGLPYITSLKNDPVQIAQAIRHAIEDLDPTDRDLLCIHDLIDIPKETYLSVPKP